MSIAYKLIYAAHSVGTHHKLALDALSYLQDKEHKRWRNLFLQHVEKYLAGSKAPDTVFKDFKNHVLHVNDGFWGGAPEKAYEWYCHFVTALKEKRWEDAVYCAGVLSHYYTDPLQPLHTAQSQKENNIHRAFEWSISKCYDQLQKAGQSEAENIVIDVPDRFDWIEQMICRGAIYANSYYDFLVSSYDFAKGAKRPKAGLDAKSKQILADLIVYTSKSFAHVLDRAFEDAAVVPPDEDVFPKVLEALSKLPTRWLKKRMANWREARRVIRMYVEYKRKGYVEEFLPEDDRIVRDLFFEEVVKPAPTGSLAAALRGLEIGSVEKKRSVAKKERLAEPAKKIERKKNTLPTAEPVTQKADVQVDTLQPTKFASQSIEQRYALPEESGSDDTLPETVSRQISPDLAIRYEVPVSSHHTDEEISHKLEETYLRKILPPEMAELAIKEAASQKQSNPTRKSTTTRKTPGQSPQSKNKVSAPKVEAKHGAQSKLLQNKETAFLPDVVGAKLKMSDDIERAPSIGPKTAQRFYNIGISSVHDFLSADPILTSKQLDVSYITKSVIIDWQDQAKLVCTIPDLKGQHAQLLVGAGCRTAQQIATTHVQELLVRVRAFCKTTKGERILRSSPEPDLESASEWVKNAQRVASSEAA